ncbi:MAG: L-lactate dehydrogenase [Xanthomonadales bacterium]|nr:L-lactate dehydrogenase [Xanthomonadales bacterium]MCC6592006.1 L-lactate dehydrogenase [Xanthomonadales bacterium]MCE7932711.1 L-lactate dehydrogenase [Xanthomonadales bacterium PRO6]
MYAQTPVTPDDYQRLARRRLPGFLADYVDGGAGDEQTLAANSADWARLKLRQRVLVDVSGIETSTTLLGESCALPLALAPIGLAGMMARRGEAQAARVARAAGLPFTLSTVGICSYDEVIAAAGAPCWFQLYMLRDRALVQTLLERVWASGCRTLLFTVDLPLAGMRHRDTRHGLGLPGLRPKLARIAQLLARPGWIVDVGLRGKPHAFGNLGEHVPAARDLDTFRAWIDSQFDPGVTWRDIEWLRGLWRGKLVLKGLLDVADAQAAVGVGVDGIVVSNHGGRQLDGAPSTASKLPAIAQAIGARTEVLVDGGLRSGMDLYRALALGARGALIGRPWVWALAGGGRAGLASMLEIWRRELANTMALTGVARIADIGARQIDGA